MDRSHLLTQETIPTFDELLGNLGDEEVELLSGYFRKVEFVPGESIFYENEESDSLYVIQAGSVEISKFAREDDGEYTPLVTLNEGNIIGEVSFLTETDRSASAVSSTHTVLYELTRSDFREIYDSHPKLACKIYDAILRVLAYRLERTDRQLIQLAADQDVAHPQRSG